MFMD
jgi:hypothetical protein